MARVKAKQDRKITWKEIKRQKSLLWYYILLPAFGRMADGFPEF